MWGILVKGSKPHMPYLLEDGTWCLVINLIIWDYKLTPNRLGKHCTVSSFLRIHWHKRNLEFGIWNLELTKTYKSPEASWV